MAAETTPDDRLEAAKERLQGEAEATPAKRAKSPASFHVFMLQDSNTAPIWAQLTDDPVTAPNRKQAIHDASSAMTLEEKAAATFWAVPADQFQPLKPKPRQEVVYDWE